MTKYLRISSYIRKPFFIYDFATAPFWISLYMRKIRFFFVSEGGVEGRGRMICTYILWWKLGREVRTSLLSQGLFSSSYCQFQLFFYFFTRTSMIAQITIPESYFTHVVLGCYFIYDGSSTIQVFPLLVNIGIVVSPSNGWRLCCLTVGMGAVWWLIVLAL